MKCPFYDVAIGETTLHTFIIFRTDLSAISFWFKEKTGHRISIKSYMPTYREEPRCHLAKVMAHLNSLASSAP